MFSMEMRYRNKIIIIKIIIMEAPHSGSHPHPLLGSRTLPVREATTSQQLCKTRQQPSTQAETTKPEQLALQPAPDF